MKMRLDRLREKFPALELDAFFVSSPENRRYLSGFAGSAGFLVISRDAAVLATDFRYTEQAALQAPDFRVDRISGGMGWLPELFKELGVKRVGFESGHMTVALHTAIINALKEDEAAKEISLVATAQFIDPLRAIKEPEELALLTRAMEIADHAFAVVAPTIEVGDTEESVAWRLELAMREAGAEAVAFETIIASGPNAAKPHHHPTERRIGAGEPVVMDFGARYLGYNSDMTRTICLGEPDEMFRIVYDTVLNAQMTASVTVDPTMNSGEADGIARDIIDKAGYGDRFGHSLGHGIGLAVHEYPRVSPRCDDPLVDGTVFTIEPGIYIPGWGGVRIEDTVVMENGKVRSLTTSHKHENPKHA